LIARFIRVSLLLVSTVAISCSCWPASVSADWRATLLALKQRRIMPHLGDRTAAAIDGNSGA
jgi:hypothetical protein